MIRFPCEHCSHPMEAHEVHALTETRCPACGRTMRVPRSSREIPSPEDPSPDRSGTEMRRLRERREELVARTEGAFTSLMVFLIGLLIPFIGLGVAVVALIFTSMELLRGRGGSRRVKLIVALVVAAIGLVCQLILIWVLMSKWRG